MQKEQPRNPSPNQKQMLVPMWQFRSFTILYIRNGWGNIHFFLVGTGVPGLAIRVNGSSNQAAWSGRSRRFVEELEFVQCLANPNYVPGALSVILMLMSRGVAA